VKNDRYGQYEQVNGGVANDLMDKLEATEKITRQLLAALTASRGQWIQSVNAERCLKATEDAAEYFVALKPEEPLTATEGLKRNEDGFKRLANDSVLISKDEWLKRNNLFNQHQCNSFDELWIEYELQIKRLIRMQDSISKGSPIVMKEFTSPQQAQFDKAIELLEACSEDLFIEECDQLLEEAVDKFLSENGKCTANCTECKNCPTSLHEQAG